MLKKQHTLAFVVITVSLACAGSAWAADRIPDGKTLFTKNCAVCHGNQGNVSEYGRQLKPFPARNLRAIAAWLDTDELRRIITYGIHNSKMSAKKYSLDPLEIESVIQYIKTFEFTPDQKYGKKRYMQVCSVCHGKDGRARTGLGAKNLVYSNLDMKGLIHTIRAGRSGTMMTAKHHQLPNTDILNIASYVYNLRYKANRKHGALLYKKECLSCHATPDIIQEASKPASPSTLYDLDNRQLELRIRHGRHVNRAGTHVTSLSADDIQDIISYMRDWKPGINQH